MDKRATDKQSEAWITGRCKLYSYLGIPNTGNRGRIPNEVNELIQMVVDNKIIVKANGQAHRFSPVSQKAVARRMCLWRRRRM